MRNFVLGAGLTLVGAVGGLTLSTLLKTEEPRAERHSSSFAVIAKSSSKPASSSVTTSVRVAPSKPIAPPEPEELAPVIAAETENETELAIERREEQQFLKMHAEEGRDPSWAPAVEVSLNTSLVNLGTRFGFRTGRVTCKTTKCAAQVEFSSVGEAITKFKRVLHERYEPNCAVSILIPEDVAVGASAVGTSVAAPLRFNCEEARIASIR